MRANAANDRFVQGAPGPGSARRRAPALALVLLLACCVAVVSLNGPAHAQYQIEPVDGPSDSGSKPYCSQIGENPNDVPCKEDPESMSGDSDGDGKEELNVPGQRNPAPASESDTPTDAPADAKEEGLADASENPDDGIATEEETSDDGSCTILGQDICGTVFAALGGVLDRVWSWFISIAEKMAEGVMGAAYGLPSLQDSELGKRYDQMADAMKPAIVVLILLLALGMMLQPSRISTQEAFLHGLPKIAAIALALTFFPDFVGMINEATTGIGQAVGQEADIGGSLGKIFAAAGILGAASGIITANPVIGAIVAGLVLLPLIAILLIVLCVAIVKNFIFVILCLIGPVCLVCWAIPGLSAITGIWFRSLIACFMIPVLYSIETAAGSWLVASPFMGAVSAEAQDTWAPAFSMLALIVLLLVMIATPKKVLDWAFAGTMGGGGFSLRTAKRGVTNFTRELAKGAALAPGAGAAAGAARGGLAAAAGNAAGQGIASKARNLSVGGPARTLLNNARGTAGAGSSIDSGPGKQRGLRNTAGDPLKKAADLFSGDSTAGRRGAGQGLGQPAAQSTQGAEAAGEDSSLNTASGQDQAAADHEANVTREGAAASAPAADVPNQIANQQAAEAKAAEVLQEAGASGLAAPTPAAGPESASSPTPGDLDAAGVAQNDPTFAAASGGPGTSSSQPPEAQIPGDQGINPARAAFAQTGLGAAGLASVAAGAAEAGQSAKQATYQQEHAAFTADSTARADEKFAQAAGIREQAQTSPGMYNSNRGALIDEAAGLEAEGNSIMGSLPDDAHNHATRAGYVAQSEAQSVFAGDVAQSVASERSGAAEEIAHQAADTHAAIAENNVAQAQAAVSGAVISGLDASNPQAFADLESNLANAESEHARWQPGGGGRADLVRTEQMKAFREEYPKVYGHASGRPAGVGPGYRPEVPKTAPFYGPPSDAGLGDGPMPGDRSTTPNFMRTKKP